MWYILAAAKPKTKVKAKAKSPRKTPKSQEPAVAEQIPDSIEEAAPEEISQEQHIEQKKIKKEGVKEKSHSGKSISKVFSFCTFSCHENLKIYRVKCIYICLQWTIDVNQIKIVP